MNPEELKSLKRHELQRLAKQYGIKANQASQTLIERIMEKCSGQSILQDSEESASFTEKKQEQPEEPHQRDEPRSSEEEQLKRSSEESAVVSESETNLVDDLNELLDANVTRISPENISEPPPISSDLDTMTLHDILNRADTTLVRESECTVDDQRTSSSTTRLPSSSKEIINMLIDIDNENYSKQPSSPLSPAEETVDIQPMANSGETDELTPTTCFDRFSSDELLKLCEVYRERVLTSSKHEDMEILLNINSALSIKLANPSAESQEEHGTMNSKYLVREGSLVVEPRSSVIDKEEVNADNWETNIGLVEGEGDGTMDLAQLRPILKETEPSLKLASDSGATVKESPEQQTHYNLSLKQSILQHLSRQTLMSESRMKEVEAGIGLEQLMKQGIEEEDSFIEDSMNSQPKDSIDEKTEMKEKSGLPDAVENGESLPEMDSLPSVHSTLAAVRTTIPTQPEHTVIQVDLDLDNPEVSDDSKEAEQRFQEAMKASLSAVQKDFDSSRVFEKVHMELMEQKERLSASMIEKINATIEGFHSSFDDTLIESEESADEADQMQSESLSLVPLSLEIEKRNRIDCQSKSGEEKRHRTE